MKKLSAIAVVLLASGNWPSRGADWLQYGGDPQRSGWQRRDRFLNVGNASQLKLLWKRKLDNRSRGMNSLSAPTLLGPIVTHRGIKELVLIAGASDNFYAVDADLGRLFWNIHFDTVPAASAGKWPCGAGLTAAPAIAPAPPVPGKSAKPDDDEGTTPLRPLYVLSSDGNLHNLRPSDGRDMAVPLKFIPANANASNLNLAGKIIYTTTSDGCGGAPDGVWSIDATNPEAKANFSAAKALSTGVGVTVGVGGMVYGGFGLSAPPAVFRWKGREAIASASERQGLFLSSGRMLASVPLNGDVATGLATWQDASGARWIYAAARAGVRAFKVTGDQPQLTPVWTSSEMISPAPPVVMNGILFVLSRGNPKNHATLYALDATTGKQLYASGDAIDSYAQSSGLAVANGHVCFGTSDNTLYCFGFPIEIN